MEKVCQSRGSLRWGQWTAADGAAGAALSTLTSALPVPRRRARLYWPAHAAFSRRATLGKLLASYRLKSELGRGAPIWLH